MERFGKRTTGPTIDEIKTEIRYITTELPDVASVFGFGSFFRNRPFNDVDILVVLLPNCQSLLSVYYDLKAAFEALETRHEICVDFTVLTSREYHEQPLRDMDSLIPLFSR